MTPAIDYDRPAPIPRAIVRTEDGRVLAFDHDQVRAMRVAVELRAMEKGVSLAEYLREWAPRYLLPEESERTCIALVRVIFDDVHPKKGGR